MRDHVPCEFPAGYDGTAVLERLAQVLDPELDESILDLGFVRSLELRSGTSFNWLSTALDGTRPSGAELGVLAGC